MNAISVEGLTKSYGGRTVLNGLTFDVTEGEVFALLGVNGAGKTTTLECVEGLRSYDGGRVAVRGKRGIQLQSSSLPAYIRASEAVTLFAKWNGTRPAAATLDALGIGDIAKKTYASLSEGQKRRLHLALALTCDPDVVFLDEPTAGLDVEGRNSLHALIRGLKARGKIIFLASHDMAEVETLCDRIAILAGGAIAFCGTVAALTARVGRRHSVLVKTDSGERTYETDDIAALLTPLLAQYAREGVTVLEIRTDRGTLEEHFIDFAGRNDQ